MLLLCDEHPIAVREPEAVPLYYLGKATVPATTVH